MQLTSLTLRFRLVLSDGRVARVTITIPAR